LHIAEDPEMNLFSSLTHPLETWRRFRRYLHLGRGQFRLEVADFRSGLGDSAWILYSLARSLKPEVCVEIGSARGKSACYVGLALAENGKGKIYAIDPHMKTAWNDDDSVDTIDIFRRNIASLGLEDRVEIVRKPSDEAARGWSRKIDLIFIDGDHSYEGVRRDWELFSPHLSEFGVAVFHDTAWDIDPVSWSQYNREDMGIPRFVEELRRAGYPVMTFPNDCGVSLVQPRIGGIPLQREASTVATAT
jgi:predicted O-methyltransferase YrrM